MTRYNHDVYARAKTPRYLVLFDLQWQIIQCERLEPCADLGSAMTEAVQRYVEQGWQTEAAPRFGFVFLKRQRARRLLILTARDPHDLKPQAFSPFK